MNSEMEALKKEVEDLKNKLAIAIAALEECNDWEESKYLAKIAQAALEKVRK